MEEESTLYDDGRRAEVIERSCLFAVYSRSGQPLWVILSKAGELADIPGPQFVIFALAGTEHSHDRWPAPPQSLRPGMERAAILTLVVYAAAGRGGRHRHRGRGQIGFCMSTIAE